MSMESIQALRDHSRAEGADRLVAAALAFYAQRDTGLSWPSDRELMAFSQLSRSRVYRGIRTLERLGEIHRAPRADGMPRRVFIVDFQAGCQMPLFEANVHTGRRPAAKGERPPADTQRVLHARAGSNRQNRREHSPQPPQAGEHSQNLIQSNQTSRRRRRRTTEQCIPEPCPGAERLHSAWVPLEARLASALGEHWTIWGSGAHLHELAADELVLAFEPSTVSSVRRRFGERIALVLADRVVRLVGCEQIGGRR